MRLFTKYILLAPLTCIGKSKMENTYYTWKDYVNNFGKEISIAEDVYDKFKKDGLKHNSLAKFDFHFLSDKKEKLELLKEFLLKTYPYEFVEFSKYEEEYELHGITNEIPITLENLMYWALDMVKRGYEFDSDFNAYGAEFDSKNQNILQIDKSKEDQYFDKAIELYNKGDLSGAIINLNITLEINPKEPNSYYSRAIIKNELNTWKAALRDYDKAIDIAPKFANAIENRGTLKDYHKDYQGAIKDYNKALELSPDRASIYFNRGNSYYNLKKEKEACSDWKKAKELGAEYAEERIKKYCKNK